MHVHVWVGKDIADSWPNPLLAQPDPASLFCSESHESQGMQSADARVRGKTSLHATSARPFGQGLHLQKMPLVKAPGWCTDGCVWKSPMIDALGSQGHAVSQPVLGGRQGGNKSALCQQLSAALQIYNSRDMSLKKVSFQEASLHSKCDPNTTSRDSSMLRPSTAQSQQKTQSSTGIYQGHIQSGCALDMYQQVTSPVSCNAMLGWNRGSVLT